jgi:catechol 2,3-dioxygenase-like lactoylglutathione lyase family enzyme
MEQTIKSIRPFIGAKDFDISRRFYTDLGFQESILSSRLSLFKMGDFGFYLQDAYVQDWIDNTMVFLEVEDVDRYWSQLSALGLTTTYQTVKLVPIKSYEWGKECFLHDPAGILWHIGEFAK